MNRKGLTYLIYYRFLQVFAFFQLITLLAWPISGWYAFLGFGNYYLRDFNAYLEKIEDKTIEEYWDKK
jgi:hypothetical protein